MDQNLNYLYYNKMIIFFRLLPKNIVDVSFCLTILFEITDPTNILKNFLKKYKIKFYKPNH